MNVLLIEPDRLLGKCLKPIIESAGNQAHIATSAQSAVSILDEKTIDLIVLEPQLGLHNGIEFLYELRSYADWQAIPVVIHSANRAVLDSQFTNSWRQMGATNVLYKPQTSNQQLLKVINSTIPATA